MDCLDYTLLTPSEVILLQDTLRSCPPGDVVVCGTYRGGDVMALHAADPSRNFVVVDSFRGNSLPTPEDAGCSHGLGSWGCPAPTVRSYLRAANVPCPEIHSGWITPESLAVITDRPVALVWIDLDLFAPTLAALRRFVPWLVREGVALVHDLDSDACPGITRACASSGLTFERLNWRTGVYRAGAVVTAQEVDPVVEPVVEEPVEPSEEPGEKVFVIEPPKLVIDVRVNAWDDLAKQYREVKSQTWQV